MGPTAAADHRRHLVRRRLHLRLEGGPGSVEATRKCLGGDTLDDAFWSTLREQRLDVFTRQDDPRPLWRLSLPQQAPTPELEGVDETAMLHDWAGAQRWLRSAAPDKTIHDEAVRLGGHATRWTPAAAAPSRLCRRCLPSTTGGSRPSSIPTASSIPGDSTRSFDMQTHFTEQDLEQPHLREAERVLRTCVHCGFCNATCPTYQLLGDERDGRAGAST